MSENVRTCHDAFALKESTGRRDKKRASLRGEQMQTEPSTAAARLDGAVAAMPLLAAAELQDHLMTVTNDLERLQRLLDDAGEALSTHFYSASNQAMSLLGNGNEGPAAEALKQIIQDIA